MLIFYRWKESIKTLGAVFSCALVLLFAWFIGAFSLPQGAVSEEYYLYSASSQAQRKVSLSWTDLPFLKGQSATYERADGEGFACECMKAYRAVVLFCEEVGQVRSYYCYSPRLGGGVTIDGTKVNLHIAVCGKRVKIGTPLIFGGY